MRPPQHARVTAQYRAVAGLLAALLAAASSAGCGLFGGGFPDPFTIAGASLSKEQGEALLRKADDKLPGLIEEQNANSNEARCYFSFREGADDTANGFLRCGPVRVYGEAEDANWLKLGVYKDEQGQLRLTGTAGGSEPPSPPSPLSGDEELKRPDGEEPADAEDIAEPRPRAGKPGQITVERTVQGLDLEEPTGPATLLAPDASVALTKVGTDTIIGTGAAARKAADGEEFVYAQLDLDPQRETATKVTRAGFDEGGGEEPGSDDSGDAAEHLTWTVVAGSERHELDEKLTDNGVLAVSVPKGEKVSLELRDRDEAQSLDLRSGERTRNKVFDPLYRKTNIQRIDESYQGTNRTGFGTVELSADVNRAALVPYVEGKGYPPEGRAWLVVNVTERDRTVAIATFSPSTYTFTVDGEATTATAVAGTANSYLVTPVPTDLTEAAFTVQGKGKAGGNPANLTTPFTMEQKLTVSLSLPK